MDTRRLRDCLGHFATGVTVVTTRHGDVVHGATVNAFAAVSLEPPLILVSLSRRSTACRYLEGAPFCVNVLTSGQERLARHFAGHPSDDPGLVRWHETGTGGVPRLHGCLAHIACAPWASYDGGDHVLFLGEVRHFELGNGTPILFYRGELRELGETLDHVPWMGSLDGPTWSSWAAPFDIQEETR